MVRPTHSNPTYITVLRTGFTAILFVLLPLRTANASPTHLVVPGEYVVTLADDATVHTTESDGLSVQSLGSGSALVKRSSALMSTQQDKQSGFVAENLQDSFCTQLIASGRAISCSPNYKVEALATPQDPQFSSLWGLSNESGIAAAQAWDKSTGSSSVVVAVIDTGVDYSHPDLHRNMWVNTAEIQNNGIDDDQNGYVDDIHGINANSRSGNPMDDNGHGTHVAGTIGAVGNNNVGVVGVNWDVRIMALKFLTASGSGTLASAIEAINYMVRMKERGVPVRIANNSWGGGGYSQPLFDAIERAHNAGILFIAAAGNEANNNDANPSYPASYQVPNVVSVAAIDQNQNLAGFSNYGATTVDIAAPGVSILSTFPGSRYTTLSGTSMATPHVTGALALLLGSEPQLSNEELVTRMYASGLDSPTLQGLVSTGRKLNVARMLNNETAPVPAPTPPPASCSYLIEEIPFAPDLSADTAPLVMQADEYNFYGINLPFSFSLFGQASSSLFASPNGVLYFGTSPSAMDYQNSEYAPLNSIAALHSDLVAADETQGLRVAVGSDRVTLYWLVSHFQKKTAGPAAIRLVLYNSGVIENFVTFTSAETEGYLQSHATIGLSGADADNRITYAYNSSAIRSNLGLRYTPQCGGNDGITPEPAQISKVKIEGRGVENSNWMPARLMPGRAVRISLLGRGSGSVAVSAAFDGQQCGITRTTQVSRGIARLKTIVPRAAWNFRSIEISVPGQAKRVAKIIKGKNAKARRKSQRKQGIDNFSQACEALMQSIRER